MHHKLNLLASCAVFAAAIGSFAGAAAAAEAEAAGSNMIEELVVTAEKREQSLQDVPVAVSAFTDERREMVGINSVQDLTNFTPGLAYATNNDRIAMRGIGRFTNNRSSEGGVAMYSDGAYTSSVTAFAQSTLFIDRTEALRGPQGTLYGRNSIGGALNIISKRPTDDFYAEVRGGIGNYKSNTEEAAVSGPLFGTLRGRLAGSYSHIGEGVFTNLNPTARAKATAATSGPSRASWTARSPTASLTGGPRRPPPSGTTSGAARAAAPRRSTACATSPRRTLPP